MTNTQLRDINAKKAIEQVQAFGEALKAFVVKTHSDEEIRRMRHTSWGQKNLGVSQSETDTASD
jgi:hypothetical protein